MKQLILKYYFLKYNKSSNVLYFHFVLASLSREVIFFCLSAMLSLQAMLNASFGV